MGISDYGKTASTYITPTGLYAAVITRVSGTDVYVQVPDLSVDFEHGPILYIGSPPPAGRNAFVGFLNGDPDTVVGLFSPTGADLDIFLALTGGTMSGGIDMAGNDLDNVGAIKPDNDLEFYKADGATLSLLWDESADRWQCGGPIHMDGNQIYGVTEIQANPNESLLIKDEQGVTRIEIEDNAANDGDIIVYDETGTVIAALWDSTQGSIDLRNGTDVTLNGTSAIVAPLDPTAGTHVGDRDYNDARYPTKSTPLMFSSGDIELEVKEGTGRLKMPYACTLISATATCGVAPTGADVVVDVNKNGTTMFSTKPTITASSQDGTPQTPSVTAVALGDILTVDIDQVGSTLPGENLTVVLDIEVP